MALLGTLSEFPLPEVMLLLGKRTGSLRLYDVPRRGHMEVDVDWGRLHALRYEGETLTEISQIVQELCFVVESSDGMFEFLTEKASGPKVKCVMSLDRLVMMLISEVDESIARRHESFMANIAYSLANPTPDIWIDDSLASFLAQSRLHLKSGIGRADLAHLLGEKDDVVCQNLDNLCELGFVKEEVDSAEQGSISSDAEQHAQLVQNISELKKITGKLMEVFPRVYAEKNVIKAPVFESGELLARGSQ